MSPVMIDSIVIIIMLLSAIFAFFRGFVRELLTIVNLGGAAVCAWLFSKDMLPVTDGWMDVDRSQNTEELAKLPKVWGVVPPDMMSAFLSYAIIFFGVFLILSLAGFYISSTIKALGLGPVDKILGFAFGAARGFLIVFLLYLPFGYFLKLEKLPEWAQQSVAVQYLDKAYIWFDDYQKSNEDDIKEAGDKLIDKVDGAGERVTDQIKDATDAVREKDLLRDDERGNTENLMPAHKSP